MQSADCGQSRGISDCLIIINIFCIVEKTCDILIIYLAISISCINIIRVLFQVIKDLEEVAVGAITVELGEIELKKGVSNQSSNL